MKLLFYATEKNGFGKHLEQAIGEIVPKENIEAYHSFANLSKRLYQPRDGLTIAVLSVAHSAELLDLLSLDDLLSDYHIILILPENGQDMALKAHRLRPRFLTFADRNFGEIKAVLNKMLETERR